MSEIEKVISDLELIKASIEWEETLDYQIMIDNAIQTIRELQKIKHIIFDVGECDELADNVGEKFVIYCKYYESDCNKCMVHRIAKILKEVE